MDQRTLVPWWGKICLKVILSRLPVDYSVWRRLSVFKKGLMNRPDHAYRVFRTHVDRAGIERMRGEFVVLEMGPGDALTTAIIAQAHGGSFSYLVDVGHYATANLEPYLAMAQFLGRKGLPVCDLSNARTLTDVCSCSKAKYLTEGLESLRLIPDASIDFIFSEAVLEHVSRADFQATVSEMRRIIKPDGVCSHQVDLKDHLAYGLNNLRFPRSLWESRWLARSGFYTNRIRYSEMMRIFGMAGFSARALNVSRWPKLPIRREKLHEEFSRLPDDDLLIASFGVVLNPLGTSHSSVST